MLIFMIGTRPDIIKMSEIVNRYDKDRIVVHTSQHYTDEMDEYIRKDVNVKPDVTLDIPTYGDTARNFHWVVKEFSEFLKSFSNNDSVVVYGDTMSALAVAVASKISGKGLVHIEAGLRCRDLTLPEEVARTGIDAISDLMFAPTNIAEDNLIVERVDRERIRNCGHPIRDVLFHMIGDREIKEEDYAVMTLHRQENVKNEKVLEKILRCVSIISLCANCWVSNVKFYAHPAVYDMARRILAPYKSNITLHGAASYNDFLNQMLSAKYVITDSGGIQEEVALLKKKCLTIRRNTERPETIHSNSNLLVKVQDLETEVLLMNVVNHFKKPVREVNYGKNVTEKIVEELYLHL